MTVEYTEETSKMIEEEVKDYNKETPVEEESSNETINNIEFIGFKDYRNKVVTWFTLGPKAFPTKPVNSWLIMRLAKAQNSKNEELALAATYDLLEKMIPVKYRIEFDDHMSDYPYSDDELNAEISHVMQGWGNQEQNVTPLPQKKPEHGSPMPQSESPTYREVLFSTGQVAERPLTPEEMAQWEKQMQAIDSAELDRIADK